MIEPMLISKKRKNAVDVFDKSKIYKSIDRARKETGEFEKEEVEIITNDVLKMIEMDNRFDEFTVDDVRNFVHASLLAHGKKVTAGAYMYEY